MYHYDFNSYECALNTLCWIPEMSRLVFLVFWYFFMVRNLMCCSFHLFLLSCFRSRIPLHLDFNTAWHDTFWLRCLVCRFNRYVYFLIILNILATAQNLQCHAMHNNSWDGIIFFFNYWLTIILFNTKIRILA